MKHGQSSRPKVLVITSTFPRWENDSEPAFVFELSRRLGGSFDITVLAPRSCGSKKRETMEGLTVIRFPYFFNKQENLATHSGGILNRLRANPLNYFLVPFFLAGQFLALTRLLHKQRFDLIHAHWIIPQGLITVISLGLLQKKIPVICTSHGGDLFALQRRLFQWIKRRVIDKCDILTVVSNAMQNTVIKMGADPEKIRVISMGVDLTHVFTPDPHVKRKSRELLFVGRLVEKKGLSVLLAAMPKIIEKYPDVYLTVAGAGPLEKQAKKFVSQNKLSGRVTFFGMLSQKELPMLYRRAAIAVFPFVVAKSGDQEGLGLVVVEAMGCGCPVVASDLPAVRDAVDHKDTGMLVEPGSPEALAEAVTEAFQNPEMRADMAANARKKAVEKFDWEVITEKYLNLYEKLTTSNHLHP